MMTPPDNRYLRRSSVSVPREQRTAWQLTRLAIECILIVGLLIGIAVVLYNIYQRILQQNLFPLKRVIIEEPLHYGDLREVSEILRNHHQRNLLHMDVALLADEMQRLDWVAKASVYKRWPDAVEVKLEERVPVVRWGGNAFLDNSGVLFSIPDNDKLRELATIYGPDGYEQQVLQYWHDIAPWLAARPLEIQQLTLDQRLVWHAELTNGLDVILGRDQLNERLKKLVIVNKKVIEPYHRYIEAIDLRYHDGFSVRWKAGVKPVTAEKNTSRNSSEEKAVIKVIPVEKTTIKEKPVISTPAKEKSVAKAPSTEKTNSKEKQEKMPVKPTSAVKEAPKDKAPIKNAPVEKVAAKEIKEKPVTKSASVEKGLPKENKEKVPAKATPTEKTPNKQAKEKKPANPTLTKATGGNTSPQTVATERVTPKDKSTNNTVTNNGNTKDKTNPGKTTTKSAPASKAATKEKDSAKGKK
jgi:hypothetical protein